MGGRKLCPKYLPVKGSRSPCQAVRGKKVINLNIRHGLGEPKTNATLQMVVSRETEGDGSKSILRNKIDLIKRLKTTKFYKCKRARVWRNESVASDLGRIGVSL